MISKIAKNTVSIGNNGTWSGGSVPISAYDAIAEIITVKGIYAILKLIRIYMFCLFLC